MKHPYACGCCGELRPHGTRPLPERLERVTALALRTVADRTHPVPTLEGLACQLQYLALEASDARLPGARIHPAQICRDYLSVSWSLLLSYAWAQNAANAAQRREVAAPEGLVRLLGNECARHLEQVLLHARMWSECALEVAP